LAEKNEHRLDFTELKCIIIEDEPLAAKVLSDYISKVPFLQLKGSFKDAILATAYLNDAAVDLIFLDLHLPKVKGMAFLKTLIHRPNVIITTAYHQYAIEGFELNVTDYLLKPFGFDRFFIAVNKVKSIHTQKQWTEKVYAEKDYIFVSVQSKKVKLMLSEILFIESQKEYIKIVTIKNEYLTKMGTQYIDSMLPSSQFARIHRSYIVSISKIDSFTSDKVEIHGNILPIGRAYRHALGDVF
jgi:two-component system, LytTR family, response regulator